jgi:hypothetical protein
MQNLRSMFFQQFKLNIVAVISLVTALSGLLYNNWRDHQNEINQNMRDAAFEVLKDLGELQTIVNYAHFSADNEHGNPIEGWKHAIQVRDLSRLLNAESAKRGQQLFIVWEHNWETLIKDNTSEQRISESIAEVRAEVLQSIEKLD